MTTPSAHTSRRRNERRRVSATNFARLRHYSRRKTVVSDPFLCCTAGYPGHRDEYLGQGRVSHIELLQTGLLSVQQPSKNRHRSVNSPASFNRAYTNKIQAGNAPGRCCLSPDAATIEGYYSANPLSPQEQQRQQQNNTSHQQPMTQLLQRMPPVMAMPHASTFDSQMIADSSLLQRRASSSHTFASPMQDQETARLMSLATDPGSLHQAATNSNPRFMGFPSVQHPINNYPMLDTSSMGGIMPDATSYPALSSDSMMSLHVLRVGRPARCSCF